MTVDRDALSPDHRNITLYMQAVQGQRQAITRQGTDPVTGHHDHIKAVLGQAGFWRDDKCPAIMACMGHDHTRHPVMFPTDIDFKITMTREEDVAQAFKNIGPLADQAFQAQRYIGHRIRIGAHTDHQKECPAINQSRTHPDHAGIVDVIGNRPCLDLKTDLNRQHIGRSKRNNTKWRDFVPFDLGIKQPVQRLIQGSITAGNKQTLMGADLARQFTGVSRMGGLKQVHFDTGMLQYLGQKPLFVAPGTRIKDDSHVRIGHLDQLPK